MQKRKLLLYGLLGMLVYGLIPGSILMVKGEIYASEATVTLQSFPNNVSSNRLAVVSAPNTISNVWVEGESPLKYTWVNEANNTIFGNNPIEIENGEQYPTYLGQEGYTTSSKTPNPWDQVSWAYLENNTMPAVNQSNSYNITMVRESIGNLESNTPLDIRFAYPSQYYVTLDLSVQKAGLNFIYFDADDVNLGNYYVLNAEGERLSAWDNNLPDVSSGGDPIRSYISFWAEEKGLFQLLFIPTSLYLSFELHDYGVTQNLQMGDQITFRTLDYEDIDPNSLQSEISGLPVQIYEFEMETGTFVEYNLDFLWGDVSDCTIKLIEPTSDGYKLLTPGIDGDYHHFLNEFTGTYRLVITQDKYFEWDGGTPVKNVFSYSFYVNAVEPQAYALDSEELLQIPSQSQFLGITFNTTEHILVAMNTSIIGGSPDILIDSSPSTAIQMLDAEWGAHYLTRFYNFDGFSLYELLPGTYYTEMYHSGNFPAINDEFVRLQSFIINLTANVSTIDQWMDATYADSVNGSVNINPSSKTLISSPLWNPDLASGSMMTPNMFTFTYDNSLLMKVNITLLREDNPGISNLSLRYSFDGKFYLRSKHNGLSTVSSQVINVGTQQLSASQNETITMEEYVRLNGYATLVGEGEGLLWFCPSNVEINNGTDWLNYNETLNFRVCMVNQNPNIPTWDIGEVELLTIPYSSNFNFTEIDYGFSSTYNDSQIRGVFIPLDNPQIFDWWQFIFHTNLSVNGFAFIYILMDNPWQYEYGPAYPNLITLVPGLSQPDYFIEYGVAVDAFGLFIQLYDPDSDNIIIELEISKMNCTILYSPGISDDYQSDLGWILPASIGGGVAIIVVIGGIILYKKRHPI
ncbi:MAG: hypothetical protein ACTSYU_02245 [Promethearchaeota archaeon]